MHQNFHYFYSIFHHLLFFFSVLSQTFIPRVFLQLLFYFFFFVFISIFSFLLFLFFKSVRFFLSFRVIFLIWGWLNLFIYLLPVSSLSRFLSFKFFSFISVFQSYFSFFPNFQILFSLYANSSHRVGGMSQWLKECLRGSLRSLLADFKTAVVYYISTCKFLYINSVWSKSPNDSNSPQV